MCINLINDFFKHSDIVRYFLDIVIFYCTNTTAFPMSDWKIWEGVNRLNKVAKWVAALKILKNHWFWAYI